MKDYAHKDYRYTTPKAERWAMIVIVALAIAMGIVDANDPNIEPTQVEVSK